MSPPKKPDPRDTNKDGKVSATEKAVAAQVSGTAGDVNLPAGGDGDLQAQIAAVLAAAAKGGASDRGEVLLPYEGVDPNLYEDFDNPGRKGLGAYRARDALAPGRKSWSPEKLAAMQRTFASLGLYGGKTVVTGTYDGLTQAIFTKLLKDANVSGRTWTQQLSEWQIRPPKVADEGKAPNVVSNPIDIRKTAGSVVTNLVGGGEEYRGFVNDAVAPVQANQLAYGQGMDGTNGGTVTQAPDMEAFLEDKMRREHPIDVAGNSFLSVFDKFANFIRTAQ